jgi:N-acetylglucosaminyldiphosphoundecaprenol N-acetyl-beta-D-mannosaminyltransferase
MALEAHRSTDFSAMLCRAKMCLCDGMSLSWFSRILGAYGCPRVDGASLTQAVCAASAASGLPIGLLGSTPEVIEVLQRRLEESWPGLRIAFAISPPFRTLSISEETEMIAAMNASGARIVLVGLGCPRQERWMAVHSGEVGAVMIGVGAVFDFLSGAKRRAPQWMRHAGLEWAHRLITEPRRLWSRYLIGLPIFLGLILGQLLRLNRYRGRIVGQK